MRRVIFVDDDENLLKSIKRLLHPYKDKIEMSFTDRPQEVLELLEKESYDIVIADYKMPEMNGIELLEIIMKKYPAVKRVLLTGQSDREIFNRAREIVHSYLAKPCSNDELLELINE